MPVLLDGESKDIAQVRAVACLREGSYTTRGSERIEVPTGCRGDNRRRLESTVSHRFRKFADVSISATN